jgi:2-octaprenyl-6-methoxyphenol hydroxylase
MVGARDLRLALNARLRELPAVSVFAPASFRAERRPDMVTVRLSAGPLLACRLLVAAEGRASPLRAEAGIPVTRLSYGQSAIVFAIAHQRPHQGVALEHFLPGGPFAQLPMAPNAAAEHVSAIVWTERQALAARMMTLDDAAFTGEVARRLGGHLGAIRLLGRRWTYPLSAMIAHRYTATRLALVGDAAHGVHPIAGQGLNLGFRDVAALAGQVIAAVGRGDDPGDAALLRDYQAARRPDTLLMFAVTDLLDRLFSNDVGLVRLGRDIGLAAVQRIGPLKRLLMRQAMGVPIA